MLPEEPTFPDPPSWTGDEAQQKTEEKKYQRDLELFKIQYPQWERKDRALRELTVDIANTLSKSYIHLIQHDDTAYNRLRKLKLHFAPSHASRARELRSKYETLRKPPHNKSTTKWLEDWPRITSLMIELDMPDISGQRAQDDFLVAARSIDPSWSTNKLIKLRKLQVEQKSGETPPHILTLHELVAKFSHYLRTIDAKRG